MAARVAGSYEFGLSDATISGRLIGTVGADYFLTPSVAFGPYFSYRHIFGRQSTDYDRLVFGAGFYIYL